MAAITAAVVVTAGTVYASKQAGKQQKAASKAQKEMAGAADPYAQYRGDAAARLNALSSDPSSVQDGAVWKARQQAAARAIASQGYTGSGNAIIAAADAGAAAYQQEFDNLAMLSGANGGNSVAAGINQTGMNNQQGYNEQRMSNYAGMINNLGNLATTVGARFNQPATARPTMTQVSIPRTTIPVTR